MEFVSVKCERTETKALHDNRANRNFRNNPKFIWRLAFFYFSRFCLTLHRIASQIFFFFFGWSKFSFISFSLEGKNKEKSTVQCVCEWNVVSVRFSKYEISIRTNLRVKEMRNVSHSWQKYIYFWRVMR